ncbi:MAG: response regulator transcription factor [Sulfuricaulis sp.]
MQQRTTLGKANRSYPIKSNPSSTPTRVFVAAKPDFAIDGLLRLMKDNPAIKVLACVEPSERCWQAFHEEHPDLLLLHSDAVATPTRDFILKIRHEMPNIRIIIFGHKLSRSFLFDVVMAGVNGYINENMSSAHILKAMQSVMAGRLWVERHILDEMAVHARQMQTFVETSILEKLNSVRADLTARETTVLRLILEGMSTKDIAATMHVSEQGVKLHLSNMFAKFNVTNRSQLILHMYSRVCPVTNMIRLFRMSLDKSLVKAGFASTIPDPLA